MPMPLLALIPFGCLFCLFFILYKPKGNGIYTAARIALLKAILIICIYSVVATEALSAFRLINIAAIISIWAIPFVLLIFFAIKKKLFAKNKEIFPTLAKLPVRYPLYWFIAALLGISLVVALLYPTNNYDSLTYHMARVEHWRENQSVSHYPTHILRQLILQPFAEWVILHFRLLMGSDRLANSVQLFFLIGCLVNAALITKELGGTAKQQNLSVLFTCVLPMAMLESNTTQNDIVVSFFILSFVYFTIRAIRQLTIRNLLWAGSSLGLAWLTKGTAYIFTLLFIAWYGILFITWYREPLKKLLYKALLLMIVPALALFMNSPHFYRNSFLTGSPLGKASEGTGNEGFAMKSIAMVGFKNILNHMPVTNDFKAAVVYHSYALGVDANDPKYAYNTMDWMMTGFSFHEDYAQNFVHVLLILAATIVFLCRKSFYKKPMSFYSLYFFTITGSALLFTVLLKWQPWGNRLETPLFMLYCVFLAMEISNWKKPIRLACVGAAAAYGLVALLLNKNHPVLPLSQSIFTKSYNSFMEAEEVFECKAYLDKLPYTKLGIYIGPDSQDYYYYKLLSTSSSGKCRELKHVFVSNDSEIYLNNYVPEAIVYKSEGPKTFVYRGKEFVMKTSFKDKVWLYVPK
jgi:4-amino-4-deoxy-L-arabinose transferase-like glycosyltransferase